MPSAVLLAPRCPAPQLEHLKWSFGHELVLRLEPTAFSRCGRERPPAFKMSRGSQGMKKPLTMTITALACNSLWTLHTWRRDWAEQLQRNAPQIAKIIADHLSPLLALEGKYCRAFQNGRKNCSSLDFTNVTFQEKNARSPVNVRHSAQPQRHKKHTNQMNQYQPSFFSLDSSKSRRAK